MTEQPGGSFRIRHSVKGRFDAPSSAVSLPSIALMSTEEKDEYGSNRPRRKSGNILLQDLFKSSIIDDYRCFFNVGTTLECFFCTNV